MLPKLQLAICDVRDVAAAHIKSLTLPNAPGMYVRPHLHCTGSLFTPMEKFVGATLYRFTSLRNYTVATETSINCCNMLECIQNNNTFLIL